MTGGETLAIVVKGFPRLSETFIARELEALEARGFAFSLFALRRPGPDAALVENRVKAQPRYLPEYLHHAPWRVAKAFARARRLPGFRTAWRAFREDLASEFARGRMRRFGQACVLATEMPATIRHIHAHFAHSPTSVARYAAQMRRVTFSISAHAKDIWTTSKWDLQQKLSEAAFVTVCSKSGHKKLASFGDGEKLRLIHHGLAPGLLAANPPPQSRDGTQRDQPVRIVCVARAVEKKGLRTLLDALVRLPRDLAFRFDHYGGGEQLGALKERTRTLALEDRVTWHGAQSHADVIAALDRSDMFVLPAVVSVDGDRDGIPNALLEAQARGLAVVSTRAGGIEEVVGDGVNGRLVAPRDAQALAAVLGGFIRDTALRERLGAAALAQARRDCDGEAGYDEIAQLLRERTEG
jgi:glycosyltransferase involved in cell wall biosynthesis